jgi:phosphatidylinositol glycan class A protein
MTSINLNKVAQLNYFDADKIICVSRTTRENLRLRMNVDVDKFVVIPNALDSSKFKQSASKSKSLPIKLITVGRLFYRKGVDLLVDIIPTLFKMN